MRGLLRRRSLKRSTRCVWVRWSGLALILCRAGTVCFRGTGGACGELEELEELEIVSGVPRDPRLLLSVLLRVEGHQGEAPRSEMSARNGSSARVGMGASSGRPTTGIQLTGRGVVE